MTFLIQQTMLFAVPLMIVALAGVFSERSGIINLALEGIMIFGAFIGVLAVRLLQSSEAVLAAKAAKNWAAMQGYELLAMLAAAVMGAVFSLLLSFASINLRADQTIGAEPARSGARSVLRAYHRKPEHSPNAGGRRGKLVYDKKDHARL